MRTGTDGDLEPSFPAEPDRARDVPDAGRPKDDRRPPVEPRIPDPTRVVVCGVSGGDDLALERLAEASELLASDTPRVRAPCRWLLLLCVQRFVRAVFSATRNSTMRRMRSRGSGALSGNWTDPFPVL